MIVFTIRIRVFCRDLDASLVIIFTEFTKGGVARLADPDVVFLFLVTEDSYVKKVIARFEKS